MPRKVASLPPFDDKVHILSAVETCNSSSNNFYSRFIVWVLCTPGAREGEEDDDLESVACGRGAT